VADAKAFRLSRTAKNQKDFKVAAMHTWKYGKPFAMIICPLYQLPSTKSQIYQQASERNVCIFSYAHLIVLLRLRTLIGESKTLELLHRVFLVVASMNPSQDAGFYWSVINLEMFGFTKKTQAIWNLEKENAGQALSLLKHEALTHLAQERERIMRMSRTAAITELLKANQLDSRIKVISKVSSNLLFEVQS
jgi:HindIII restriction endonuclease